MIFLLSKAPFALFFVFLVVICSFHIVSVAEAINDNLTFRIGNVTCSEEDDCTSEKCMYLKKFGICTEVQQGMFPLTKYNCGCCIVCSNFTEPQMQQLISIMSYCDSDTLRFLNRPLPLETVVPLNPTPGTPVFKLQARDPETDQNIHYFLAVDRAGGRFQVDEESGVVRTVGDEEFFFYTEYVLYVEAEDHSVITKDGQFLSTGQQKLSIMGETRLPQYYKQKYETTIPENWTKDSDVIEMNAKSFTQTPISYVLRTKRKSGTFDIHPTTGIVKLVEDLDYESAWKLRSYFLIIRATEGFRGFTTAIEIIVKVSDVNDNSPIFDRPLYQAFNVDEDVKIGTSILKVSASDKDEGKNAEIIYSLDRNDFTIDQNGIIYTNRRLDADYNNTYKLIVTATDKGDPPLAGSSVVLIYTRNKNDQPPQFSHYIYSAHVDRKAGPNALVTAIVSSDADGDNTFFGLIPDPEHVDMFQIEENTGEIRLGSGPFVLDKDKYEFNVTSRDDGACCEKGYLITHTVTVLVVVYITDDNENKPFFEECTSYAPQIDEGTTKGKSVITVKATDNDKGSYGKVRYSVIPQPNQEETEFTVDEITGEIRTNKVFDREGNDGQFVSVTIKATDQGNPPLEGVCTLEVEVMDVNDNAPLFDRRHYEENVKQDTSLGENVLRVSATDEDRGENGAVTYNLTAPDDPEALDYFQINPDSGWISLKRALDRDEYHLHAVALDKGKPQHRASVEVVIGMVDPTNNSPVWDQPMYGPISIREDLKVGQCVISVRARSGIPDNPTVFYTLMKGSTEQTNKRDTFYLVQKHKDGDTWAEICVNYPLDYERNQQYNLVIRVENNGFQQLASEAIVCITLEDVNDEIPLFIKREQPTVYEGMPPGTKVTQVLAVDKDGTSPNNKVFYAIESQGRGDRHFSIDRETGEIYTREVFDREERREYTISVRAEDAVPSDRPNMKQGQHNSVTKEMKIKIMDKNDNHPYFYEALYQADINEDAEFGQPVIMVTASDRDLSPIVRYELTQGNIGGVFAVDNDTGVIYVNGVLDYESGRRQFKLRLVAYDNLHETHTTVIIHIKDVNDNPPMFSRPTYETTITEEDDRHLPKIILQVKANDADIDRKSEIRYFLAGQEDEDDQDPVSRNFAINHETGEIYVLRPLDRDPPLGRPQWRFSVFAEDERGSGGLFGYTVVLVNIKDVNDNAPFFPKAVYRGWVGESRAAGATVMTMSAVDFDDLSDRNNRLQYSIEKNKVHPEAEPVFTIDKDTGVISTAVCCLDRETTPEYFIKIAATDGVGMKGLATAAIKITDINDTPPRFPQSTWDVVVDETDEEHIPRAPILLLPVNDADLLETNEFSYMVVENSFGADKFAVVTNSDGSGSLKIAKPLDFEDPQQIFGFNVTIQVRDIFCEKSGEPPHVDYATARIRIRDINDNKPKFERYNIEVLASEDAGIGTSLATFRATDADQEGASRVSYAIDRSSDKKGSFSVEQNGVVSTRRTLNREESPRHLVKILAIDDGTPALTATATLTVVVSDINDNAPRFLQEYRTVIMEHSPPQKVLEVQATDDDDRSKGNGPPFTFRMDPHASDMIKQLFDVLNYEQGANGDGIAILTSKDSFDREQQKEYLVPIVIKDSGIPAMTGTSTLTVIIGDVNDNKIYPGSKSIFVYNLEGESLGIPIGRVYVEDLDDWDLPDKSFSWEYNIPHPNFEVDKYSGSITMRNGTSEGKYFLKFTVSDSYFVQEVQANVSVTVKKISQEAIFNAGSIRISGISDCEFMRFWSGTENPSVHSKYDKLRNIIANLTETSADKVDIFSVSLRQRSPPITDIWFATYSSNYSNYHKASMLNGIVALNRELIEQEVGINIVMVGIDECLSENVNCETSCTNVLMLDGQAVVVDNNRTSFVGVNTLVQPKCTCGARDFSERDKCSKWPQPCYNGGTCIESNGTVRCKCPEGFEGPQCQLTTRSFNGQGWAWFPSLQQCESSHLSLEFMTQKSDCLLLYNGPISNPGPGETVIQDFISLELQSGMPRLLIDFGSGTAETVVSLTSPLSDGEWHRIDIFWDKKIVRVVVDNCMKAIIKDSDPPKIDRSPCESKSSIPPFNEFLNVNTPLQLGGVHHPNLTGFQWQHQHSRVGFNGCIRNVIHNSEMYDLGSQGSSSGSEPGCPAAEESCESNNITRHCDHGTCDGTYNSAQCVCYPGYSGTECEKEAVSKMFRPGSYIKYSLPFFPDTYRTDMQLQFRTQERRGALFKITSKYDREYLSLEVLDGKLRLRFNLNHLKFSEEQELWLPNVQVSDGQWHTVRVLRYGSTASISLDGGGGYRYNELLKYEDQHQHLMIEKQYIILGGDIRYAFPGVMTIDNNFQGCIRDVRFDQRHLPMENKTEDAVVLEKQNLNDCSSRNPCEGIVCTKCDLEQLHECSCPPGFHISPRDADDFRIDGDDCLSNQGLNRSSCESLEQDIGYFCFRPDSEHCFNCSAAVTSVGDSNDSINSSSLKKAACELIAAVLLCIETLI